MTSENVHSVLDLLLQLSEKSLLILQKARPLLHQLQQNQQLHQFFQMAREMYNQLPETVSLALTVALIFLSSLLVFRVGKSLISAIVTIIQLTIIIFVAVIVWHLRGPLSAWMEQVLNV